MSGRCNKVLWLLLTIACVEQISTRQHKFTVRNEDRSQFALTSFGFVKPGYLYVNVSFLQLSLSLNNTNVIGFTLDRADSAGISPYIEHRDDDKCVFLEKEKKLANSKTDIVSITLDTQNNLFKVSRHGSQLTSLPFYKSLEDFNSLHSFEFLTKTSKILPPKVTLLRSTGLDWNSSSTDSNSQGHSKFDYDPESVQFFPLKKENDSNGEVTYGLEFVMYVSNVSHIGLYNLFFHNCYNLNSNDLKVSFDVFIVEKNGGNYLTAYEINLPYIYLVCSIVYFCCAIVWFLVLRRNSESGSVFKIHYLMLLVIVVKSLSVLIHSIDYHFINVTGQSHNTWAVLYYFTYVARGLLFFTVLMLIGSGWQLMKHVFSANEKRVFVLVIALQVVTNFAYVLKENTEEGAQKHEMWQQVFILVDLICCGAVLFPIVWSIRHLQEATKVDGKGSSNLLKLKLFRQFYMTIVCYIYFTRIVVYLLRILVNFQYRWLDAICTEAATLAFFIFTAYTFRPSSTNPYIKLSQDESDLEQEQEFYSDFEDSSNGGGGGSFVSMRSMDKQHHSKVAPTISSVEHGNEHDNIEQSSSNDSTPRHTYTTSHSNDSSGGNMRRKSKPNVNQMQKSIV